MLTTKHFAAILGFAFAAAWIAFSFGGAIVCLLAAGVFYAAAAFLQGDLDLAEVQSRLGQSQPTQYPPPGAAAPPAGAAASAGPAPPHRTGGPRVR